MLSDIQSEIARHPCRHDQMTVTPEGKKKKHTKKTETETNLKQSYILQ